MDRIVGSCSTLSIISRLQTWRTGCNSFIAHQKNLKWGMTLKVLVAVLGKDWDQQRSFIRIRAILIIRCFWHPPDSCIPLAFSTRSEGYSQRRIRGGTRNPTRDQDGPKDMKGSHGTEVKLMKEREGEIAVLNTNLETGLVKRRFNCLIV